MQLLEDDELRAKLQALIGVRCIFPSSVDPQVDGITVRCMLEHTAPGKACLYKDSTEDIIVRWKSLFDIDEKDGEVKQTIHINVRIIAVISPVV
jgi:hypothetical protein